MSEENITDPNSKVYSKEEFQQLLNGNIFRGNGNVEMTHMFRIYGWNIPSLNGIVIPQLFARGHGPIRKPDEHNMKYLDEYCKAMQCGGISITHCKVKVLGNVKFPEFVGVIDFSHNKIKNLNGVEFGCCVQLTLDNNKIESLDGCIFPEGIVRISLRHNRIRSLKGAKFPSTLKSLHITSNPLETLDGIPSHVLNQVMDGIKDEKQHPEFYRKSRVYGFDPKYDYDYQYPSIIPPESSAPPLDPNDQSDLLPHYSEQYYNNIVPAPAPRTSSASLEFDGQFFGGSRRKNNKKRKLTRKQTRKPSRKLKRKTRTLIQRRVKKTRLYKNKK
jgi:hypothetical protein